jgi:hypothetical protein
MNWLSTAKFANKTATINSRAGYVRPVGTFALIGTESTPRLTRSISHHNKTNCMLTSFSLCRHARLRFACFPAVDLDSFSFLDFNLHLYFCALGWRMLTSAECPILFSSPLFKLLVDLILRTHFALRCIQTAYYCVRRRASSFMPITCKLYASKRSKMADDEAVEFYASVSYLLDSSDDEQNGTRQRTRRVRRPRRFWMHDILLQREISRIHYDVFCYL